MSSPPVHLLVLTSSGRPRRFYSPRMTSQSPPNCTRGALMYFAFLTCIFRWTLPAYVIAPTDDSQPYVISTNVNLVVLPVTVTDRQNQFVSGLDSSQFR